MYNEEKVSVIIPVYNVEMYLEKCIDSVINQIYKNIEIIIVNDGSTDNCEKIIKRYRNIDNRIIYVKQGNNGLSSARNAGIKIATGEYVCFIDSDDWVSNKFVSNMIKTIKDNKSDIVICNMEYIYSNGRKKGNVPQINEHNTVSNIEGLKDLFNGEKFKFHAQNKLYRRRLFKENNIQFPEKMVYEDVFTTYKLFYKAKTISYLDEKLYYYLQSRPGSILQTEFNEKRWDILKALDEIGMFINNKEIDLKEEFKHLVVINIISLVNYISPIYYSLGLETKKRYKSIIYNSYSRYNLEGYLQSKNISIVEKVRYSMILKNMYIYIFLLKNLKKLVELCKEKI